MFLFLYIYTHKTGKRYNCVLSGSYFGKVSPDINRTVHKVHNMEHKKFDEIYRQYYGNIFYYIKKRISNQQDSEELASEVFTNFYKRMENFDEKKCSVSTWLYVIASNRLKNYYRDRKEELSLEAADIQTVSDEENPQNILELEEMRKDLLKALKMLPLKERSILIQKFYMGKSSAEIAENMELTPGNVRVIQKRSLEKLRKILEINGR